MFIVLLAIVAALPVWAVSWSFYELGVAEAACLLLAAVTLWPVAALLLVSWGRSLAARRHGTGRLALPTER